jgi:hypothetical protein
MRQVSYGGKGNGEAPATVKHKLHLDSASLATSLQLTAILALLRQGAQEDDPTERA